MMTPEEKACLQTILSRHEDLQHRDPVLNMAMEGLVARIQQRVMSCQEKEDCDSDTAVTHILQQWVAVFDEGQDSDFDEEAGISCRAFVGILIVAGIIAGIVAAFMPWTQ